MIRRGIYFLKEALTNLVRHPLHSVVGVMTLSVSLILVGFLGLFLWRADELVDRLSGGVQLTVFLQQDVTQESSSELVEAIGKWSEVRHVTYHSAQEDKERNRAILPRELVEELEDEVIPSQPYIEVELAVSELRETRVDEMVAWFDTLPQVEGVDDVLFGAEKISVAFSLIQGARNLGVFVGVVIVLAGLFFVITTTRLIVESRKREIEILLLVGATKNFIRIPHFVEGLIQGSMAGGLAFLVVFVLQSRLMAGLRADAGLDVPVQLLPTTLVVWFVVGGIGLGLLGSLLGVSRYMRLTR